MTDDELEPDGISPGEPLTDDDRRALVAALRKAPKRVGSKAKKLTSSHPSHEEQREIFFGLLEAPDIAMAITAVAYLERQLEALLRDAFVSMQKEDDARIFDGRSGGILGGFAAKIRIAHALGFLGSMSYSDFLLLNDIRNAFAHSLHVVSFNHPDVAADCSALQLVDLDPGFDWTSFTAENLPRARFFMSAVNLYVDLLHEQTAVVFRRRRGTLVEHLTRGLKPSALR